MGKGIAGLVVRVAVKAVRPAAAFQLCLLIEVEILSSHENRDRAPSFLMITFQRNGFQVLMKATPVFIYISQRDKRKT